jgi:hypothetical protein
MQGMDFCIVVFPASKSLGALSFFQRLIGTLHFFGTKAPGGLNDAIARDIIWFKFREISKPGILK